MPFARVALRDPTMLAPFPPVALCRRACPAHTSYFPSAPGGVIDRLRRENEIENRQKALWPPFDAGHTRNDWPCGG